ncbi:hypothetical protein D3C87_2111530 [compost metagenome]
MCGFGQQGQGGQKRNHAVNSRLIRAGDAIVTGAKAATQFDHRFARMEIAVGLI